MELSKSPVIFREEDHTYWNGLLQISGITAAIGAILFPDKYANISKKVLEAAARRGTMVHKEIENYEKNGVPGESSEFFGYLRLKKDVGLACIENEFLVSDNKTLATQIDIVGSLDGGKSVDLFDIKTTSKLDKEYVSWQLSICAMLFEMQTGVKVNEIYALYLRDEKAELVKVNRRSDKELSDFMFCFETGAAWVKEEEVLPIGFDTKLLTIKALEQQIIDLKQQQEALEAKKSSFISELYEAMYSRGIKKWETDNMNITLVLPTEGVMIDSKLLKERFPDIAKQCEKPKSTKGYLKITLK